VVFFLVLMTLPKRALMYFSFPPPANSVRLSFNKPSHLKPIVCCQDPMNLIDDVLPPGFPPMILFKFWGAFCLAGTEPFRSRSIKCSDLD